MATRSRPLYEATRLARWISRGRRGSRGARRRRHQPQGCVSWTWPRCWAHPSHESAGSSMPTDPGHQPPRPGHHAAAVGLMPYVKLYPLGRRLLDQPQLSLLAQLRGGLHPSWARSRGAGANPSDLRAWGLPHRSPDCAILVEAYTRFSDYQAQVRSAHRKQADLGATRLILLLAATHANRSAIREAGVVARDSFPLGTKASACGPRRGRDPGRSPSSSCEVASHTGY